MKLFDRFLLPNNIYEHMLEIKTTCSMMNVSESMNFEVDINKITCYLHIGAEKNYLLIYFEFGKPNKHDEELVFNGMYISKIKEEQEYWYDVYGCLTLDHGMKLARQCLSEIE